MTALVRQPENLSKAEPQIQQILQSVPDHAPALMALALLREQQGNLSEARTLYERLLYRYPAFTPATRQLAVILADQGGDDAKAYELATKARTALPADELVAKALGKLAYRKGDYRYAAQLLRESAQKRPRDSDLFFHLGMTCKQLKQNQEARTALETALRLSPDAPFAPEAKRAIEEIKQG
jgi:Flp pilus assembly protein TadD